MVEHMYGVALNTKMAEICKSVVKVLERLIMVNLMQYRGIMKYGVIMYSVI